MILDEPAYLEHYGKKGMKWGVRNANNKLARKQLNSPGAKIGYKIGKAINEHPRTARFIAAGATFSATLLTAYGTTRVHKKAVINKRISEQAKLDAAYAANRAELEKKIGPLGRH